MTDLFRETQKLSTLSKFYQCVRSQRLKITTETIKIKTNEKPLPVDVGLVSFHAGLYPN